MSKPVIRVSWLEAFRKYIEQSEYDYYEITEQSVIDSISGAFQGNEYTKIGTAFHACIETATPACNKIDAGERHFLYYGRDTTEPVPCGREFEIEGDKVCLDIAQIKTAIGYRNTYPEAFHEIRTYKDYGNAIVTGCADVINGIEIRDIKTKYSTPNDADYLNSAQWRFYLELFEADVFHFDLFIFEGYNKEKHGFDVRGLPIKLHTPAITCYRYEGMERDNKRLIDDFLQFCEQRNLLQCLTYNKVNDMSNGNNQEASTATE